MSAIDAEKSRMFIGLIDAIEKADIRYAIAGNTEGYPEKIGSDVDIIIHNDDMPAFHELIRAFGNGRDSLLVQCLKHEIVAYYYVLARETSSGIVFLQPDVCTDYYRNARCMMQAKQLLQNRRTPEGKNFFILAPEQEFSYYLIKKIGKKNINRKQFGHLASVYAQAPRACIDAIAEHLDDAAFIKKIFDAASDAAFSRFSEAIPRLRQGIIRKHPIRFADRIRELFRKIQRVMHPTGFVICVPKNTPNRERYVEALHTQLAGAFRRQADLESSIGITKLLRARIASTLIVLDGMPSSHKLVDLAMQPDETANHLATRAIHALAERLK